MRFFRDLGASLERRRFLTYCGVALAVESVVFLFLVAGTHGLIVPLSRPTSTDFVSFYAAGALADAGTPELSYDQLAHYRSEENATAAGIEYRFFYYPPVFLLLCAALARLPYIVAFLAFELATLVLYLIVARRILGEPNWSVVVPLLAFPPVFWTLGLGQNAFLTAALFGAGTLYIDRRPVVAACCSARSATSRISVCWYRSPCWPDATGSPPPQRSPRLPPFADCRWAFSGGRPGTTSLSPRPDPMRLMSLAK
jgi:hypothetical protein